MRPLGHLAFGLGAVAAVLAPTYFLSVWGVVAAVPALALGMVCLREPEVADLGRVAVVLALLAMAVAAAVVIGFS